MSNQSGAAHAAADLRLVARLREQANDVRRMFSGFPEESLSKRVMPDKWSLKELVCHLYRVEQVFRGRVEAMLREDHPEITPYDPDEDAEFDKLVPRPGSEILSVFLRSRESFLQLLERLAPEDWRREGNHPEFPRYDVRFQVEYMLYHEGHHLYQMYQRRALLSPSPR